jgi:hypothetical protein
MHRICLEVIINTFKPLELVRPYGSFDKSTVCGKFVICVEVIRLIFLKMPVEVILFPNIRF